MVLLYTITCCYALLHTVTRFSKEDSLKFEKEIEIEECDMILNRRFSQI